MVCSLRRASLFAVLLVTCPRAFPQQPRIIRVGVPVMKNSADRSVPANQERDRLVRALNDEKTDKKLHLKVQGVALEGASPQDVVSQAEAKNCDYIVYTTLIELRTQGDPVDRRAGTININPNSQRGVQDPESAAMNPEFQATVEYKLYRTGDPVVFSGAAFSAQEAMPDSEVVGQVMDRIANRVFDEVKKHTSPPS
jgi:hypothetical protein